MGTVLGISCFYHDSAATLVRDGQVVAAAQEERFSRRKHDAGFPHAAMAYCLEEGGLRTGDLDAVVFYEKPLLKFDRLLATWLSTAPLGLRAFTAALPNWLKEKLHHPRLLRRGVGKGYKKPFLFCGHHESHAASAFYPSPFEEAAILTLDGVGEWETATIGIGRGAEITPLRVLHFPHSPGLLYSAFTHYLGFRVNSGEYKVMGLAPYGRPVFRELILEKLLDLKDDGSFALRQEYFDYVGGLTMTSRRFERLFGRPRRQPETPLGQHEMDVAASLQSVMETIVHRMAATAAELTGLSHLCMAGGVALNSVANGKLSHSGLFKEIWIQPASGDAGGSLGAALRIAHTVLREPRRPHQGPDGMRGARLGPAYDIAAIRAAVEGEGLVFEELEETALLAQTVASLNAGEVVGWFEGRMEFGPRALGGRSILGDPRKAHMQRQLNQKIKFRESFRPFAPIVLADKACEYFDLAGDSPYMLLVDAVRPAQRLPVPALPEAMTGEDRVRALLAQERSRIPAVTHVDGSARVQTVDAIRQPRLHRLLRAWADETGLPVLVNTSFNIRGEPIVRSPEDALRCFLGTEMDLLVMENILVRKRANPGKSRVNDAYKAAYPLD